MNLEEQILSSLDRSTDEPEPIRSGLDNDDYDKDNADKDEEEEGDSNEGDSHQMPHEHKGAQTGIKGVLADKKESDRLKAEKVTRDQRQLLEKIKKMSITLRNADQKKDNSDEELDLEDDEFLRQYESQRLQQMMASSQSRPTFGTFKNIKVSEYIDAIDKTDKSVPVIIHLYQDHILECVRINEMLDRLGQKYIHAKFLRIIATEADENYDDVALPTILAYQNGELIANITHAVDELEDTFEITDLENLLLKHNAIKEMHAGKNSSMTFNKTNKNY